MELVTGYAWIAPAVIVAGWLLSWWGPRWSRWLLLLSASAICALCVVVPFLVLTLSPKTPFVPRYDCQSPLDCSDWSLAPQLHWAVAGLIGLVFCVELAVVTAVIDRIISFRRRSRDVRS